jgi:hypothetical protein
MKPIISSLDINRRVLLSALAVIPALSGALVTVAGQAQTAATAGALPSDGGIGPFILGAINALVGVLLLGSPSAARA